AHEGPVGQRDLLDRRRPHHVERRGRLGLSRHQRRLHLGDAAPHGHDQLQPHRGGAEVVPRRLSGPGDTFAGYRARLVETLRAKGIRDLAVRKALAATVFSVERVQPLALAAQRGLREAGVTNVSVLLGDGTLGWSAYAPYDAILVTAGGPDVPPPLVEQLAPGGRLLIPLGMRGAQ